MEPVVSDRHVANARDLAHLVQQVPSLPLTFQRINDLVKDPRTGTAQLAEAVGADQGLATRILRLANSSFYGLAARVDTITQAVSLIGTRQLRELALATAVVDLFRDIPAKVLDGAGFWQHSLAVGTTARLLAAKRGARETERHFVAGLMHDIGLVVAAQQMPERLAAHLQMAAAAAAPLAEIEQRELGFDHAELAAHLIGHWRLPAAMAEAAGGHHQPSATAIHPDDCALVHVADVLVEGLGYGSGGEPQVPPLAIPSWEVLGLAPGDLAPLGADLERQMIEITAIFMP
jgi:HD-like signal output (HDOD) protein